VIRLLRDPRAEKRPGHCLPGHVSSRSKDRSANVHLAASSTNVVFQETVRAHVCTLYQHIVDRGPVIEQGAARLPEAPGLGTGFLDSLFIPRANSHRRSFL
jgi:L-alanine-DL-glutamate epimerase-like enolase superfamily enzyme